MACRMTNRGDCSPQKPLLKHDCSWMLGSNDEALGGFCVWSALMRIHAVHALKVPSDLEPHQRI